ncbi:hypothetical protein ACFL5T_02680 [Gemmatimonadota bacterium]
MAGGRYKVVRQNFWTDPDIKRLPTEGRLLLLYLITGPHSTMLGLYYLPLAYAAVETGLQVEDVRRLIKGALSEFVTYDEQTDEVLVHRAALHQLGGDLKRDDNRVKSSQSLIDDTHSSLLISRFFELYPSWPLRSPLVSPIRGAQGAPPKGAAPVTASVTAPEEQEIFDYWRQCRSSLLGKTGGPPMQFTEKRTSKLRSRLAEGYTPDQIKEAIQGCLSNPRNVAGGYLDLELICRDQQHVEQYRAWFRNGCPGEAETLPADPAPDALEALSSMYPEVGA